MKFRVERDVLAEAVTWAARGLPTRPPVPVLAGVLLEADAEGTLTLSAFDYEVSARVTVTADVHEGGTVLVSGHGGNAEPFPQPGPHADNPATTTFGVSGVRSKAIRPTDVRSCRDPGSAGSRRRDAP